MLSSRPLALEEFLQEKEEQPPLDEDGSPLAPVPVLLLPGETMELYQQNFELWLSMEGVTIASVEKDPVVERRLRSEFADSRAWELQRRRSQRSREEEHNSPLNLLDSHDNCNKTLKKKPAPLSSRLGPPVAKEVHNGPPKSSSGLQHCAARSRDELLATRVMSVKSFWNEVEGYGPNGPLARGRMLPPIAVVLRPRETLTRYEENFQRWLRARRISQSMVNNDPEEERRFRQYFAYLRARSGRAPSCGDSSRRSRSHTRSVSRSPIRPRSRTRSPPRSSSCSGSPMSISSRSSKSTSSRCSTSSRQRRWRSHVIQRPNSPRRKRSLSPKPTQSNLMSLKRARVDEGTTLSPLLPSKHPPVNVDDELKCELVDTSGNLLQLVRKWAQQLTQQSADVARNVTSCFQELERELAAYTVDGKQVPACCAVTSVDEATTPIRSEHLTSKDVSDGETLGEGSVGSTQVKSTHPLQSLAIPPSEKQDGLSGNNVKPQEEKSDVSVHQAADAKHSHPVARPDTDSQPPPNVTIYYAAKDTLSASKLQANEDPVKTRFIEDFIRLNEQIGLNETAIEDSLAYVKMIFDIDKTGAAQHLDDIKSLTVTLNKEKRRRDSIIASVVAREWSERRDELERRLGVEVETESSGPPYDKLTSMYKKLEQARSAIAPLQVKLQNRLSWLSADDSGRDAQFQELDELTLQLSREMSAISELKTQCHAMLVAVMKEKDVVRRLAFDAMKARQ